MEFTLFKALMIIMFILTAVGMAYNAKIMNDCIDSGSPKSQACFKYNVINNNMHNLNLNVDNGE
jgi:hypothetical protein